MANIIKLKRSETAGSIPASGDLEVGEVCMNLVDGILYTKKIDGTVVTVSDKSSGHAELELVSLDTGSSAGPEIDLFRNSFSPFDSDELGKIDFSGENDNSDKKVYAKIVSKITDASNTTEDGVLEIHVMNSGTVANVAQMKPDGMHLSASKKITFGDGTIQSTAPTDDPSGIALDGLLVKCPDGTSGGIVLDGLLTKVGANNALGKISRLDDDKTPRLGGDLVLASYDITGTGDINITGSYTGSLAGTVTGVTQAQADNSTQLATTNYVDTAVGNATSAAAGIGLIIALT